MSRQSPGQRWCSLVLLALFLSLLMYFGMPAMAFRIGQAIEAVRSDGQVQPAPAGVNGTVPDEGTAHLARASREVRPAVVRIDALKPGNTASGGGSSGTARESAGQSAVSHGCGLVIDRQGWVVTSRRVVSGATAIQVHLPSFKDAFSATLVGSDADTDLAVLKFDPPAGRVPVVPLGDGAPIEIGALVMAVGHATRPGEFLWVGVVNSAGARASPACCNVHDCIHTTAVNSWNFGGPLLNLDGRVVGINIALREADGLPVGVAVPAATARQVVAELQLHGQVRRGWLGVFIHKAVAGAGSDLPGADLPAADLPDRALAFVVDYVVPDSPADEGGIRAGDVICRFAGGSFASAVDLRRRIAATRPGTRTVVGLVRDGVVMTPRIAVGQAPALPPQLPGECEWGIRLLGHLSPLEARRLGVDHLPGVVVHGVEPGRTAKGLSPHDVILSINGRATPDLATYCGVVKQLSTGAAEKRMALEISSRGVPKTIVIDDE